MFQRFCTDVSTGWKREWERKKCNLGQVTLSSLLPQFNQWCAASQNNLLLSGWKGLFFPLISVCDLWKLGIDYVTAKKRCCFLTTPCKCMPCLPVYYWMHALMVAMCFNQCKVCASARNEKFPLTKSMRGFSPEFSAGFWCAINEDVAYKPEIMPPALLSCVKPACLS